MGRIKNKVAKIIHTVITLCFLTACTDRNEKGVSTEGQVFFSKVANQEVKFALSREITKVPGFSSNCSVDKETEWGILITRGVCDNDNSFSIRVTNTSSYPPSKRLKFLALHFDTTKMKLHPGEIKEIVDSTSSKITVELSRTGASLFIDGKQSKATVPI